MWPEAGTLVNHFQHLTPTSNHNAMSHLSRLTKAQLIEIIDDLEARTVEARLEQVRNEFLWLVDDVLKVIRWTYNLGADARHLLNSLTTNRT